MSRVTQEARELAARSNDGVNVRLLWDPREDAVTVSVEDSRADQRFAVAVVHDRALEALPPVRLRRLAGPTSSPSSDSTQPPPTTSTDRTGPECHP
jgi:hypothetical protein